MATPVDTAAPTALIVGDDPAACAAAAAALAAIGMRVAGTIAWRDIPDRFAPPADLAIVAIEAQGVAAETTAAALPVLIEHVAATGVRVMAAFEAGQIDAVGGALLGLEAVLLCEPVAFERIGALAALTLRGATGVNDASRESSRLQRLNEEVARIAERLAQLARRADPDDPERPATPGGIVGDRTIGYGAPPASEPIDPAEIRRAIRARRLRDDFFAIPALFEDPAWDMLLDLLAARFERRQVSVSSLCIAAAVAPTTALRWIGRLMDAGLFEREPDPADRRRAFITLSATALSAMQNYIAAIRRAGLAIG